jgi:hypothetical protein
MTRQKVETRQGKARQDRLKKRGQDKTRPETKTTKNERTRPDKDKAKIRQDNDKTRQDKTNQATSQKPSQAHKKKTKTKRPAKVEEMEEEEISFLNALPVFLTVLYSVAGSPNAFYLSTSNFQQC